MQVTAAKNEKIGQLIFASIYPLYLNRLIKNGRQNLIDEKVSFKTFFEKATMHPNAHLIKGVVCGYRIEEIPDEFTLYRQCRTMEKLIDELAKGRKMEKILRKA